jgi:hypothetical protein
MINLARKRWKCIECGKDLTLEMERDIETCVECMREKTPTQEDINDVRANH